MIASVHDTVSLLLASPSSQRTALRAGNPGRDTWEQSHPSAALTQQPAAQVPDQPAAAAPSAQKSDCRSQRSWIEPACPVAASPLTLDPRPAVAWAWAIPDNQQATLPWHGAWQRWARSATKHWLLHGGCGEGGSQGCPLPRLVGGAHSDSPDPLQVSSVDWQELVLQR